MRETLYRHTRRSSGTQDGMWRYVISEHPYDNAVLVYKLYVL